MNSRMTMLDRPRRAGRASVYAAGLLGLVALVANGIAVAAGVRPAGPSPGLGEGLTVTSVADGRLLVYGGGSAQTWNPERRTWEQDVRGGDLPRRFHHTATLTTGGRVVAVGGLDVPFTNRTQQPALASTASWRAASGRWIAGPGLLSPRLWHAAVAMPGDAVLVIGGAAAATGDRPFGALLASVELLGENASVQKASLRRARIFHTATRLADGRVLVTGGTDDAGVPLGSAELYDPAGDRWQAAAPLATARAHHAATLLPDGRVLVSGGVDDAGDPLAGTEIYDPANDAWSRGPDLIEPRSAHAALALADGSVLVAGGTTRERRPAGTLESWTAADRTWRFAGALNRTLDDLRAVPLPDGTVLLFGHDPYEGAIALAWRRDFADAAAPPHALDAALTALPDGRFVLTGGKRPQAPSALVNVYDPATGAWSTLRPMHRARAGHRAIALRDGRIVVFGGDVADDGADARTPVEKRPSHPAEIWDPQRETWTTSAALAMPDGAWAEPSLLPDGRVLLLGVDTTDAGPNVAAYRIWDPRDDGIEGPVFLPRPRGGGAVLRYPDGALLVLGGDASRWNADDVRRVLRWDPIGRRWSALSPPSASLEGARFLPLADGGALAIGSVAGPTGAQRPFLRLMPDGSWRTIAPPPDVTPRSVLQAESLADGALLLVVDGLRSWIHEPREDRWSAARHDARWTATLAIVPQADGGALAFRSTGDRGYGLDPLGVVRLDRRAGQWQPVDTGWFARPRPALVDLGNGQVLAAGGDSAVVQVYSRATRQWRFDAFLPEPLQQPAAVRTADGRVVLAGITAGETPAVQCVSWAVGEREWTPCGRFALAPGEPRRPIALRELDGERLLLVYGDARAVIRDRTGTWTTSRMQLPQSPVPPDADATGTPFTAALAGVWDPQKNTWIDGTDVWLVNGAQVVPVRGADATTPWILQRDKWRHWNGATRMLTGVRLDGAPADGSFGAAVRLGERCAVAWNDGRDAHDTSQFLGGATVRTIEAVDLAKGAWQSAPAPALAVWRASGVALDDGTLLLAGLALHDDRPGAGTQLFTATCAGVVATSAEPVLLLPSRAPAHADTAPRDATTPAPKPRPGTAERMRRAFDAIVDEAREHPQRSLLPGLLLLLLLHGRLRRWNVYADEDAARTWRRIDAGAAIAAGPLAVAALAIPHDAGRAAAIAGCVLLGAAAVQRLWHNAARRGTKLALTVPLVLGGALGALLGGIALVRLFTAFIGTLTA